MNPLEQFSPVPLFIFSINNVFFTLTTVSVMFFFSFFSLNFFIQGLEYNNPYVFTNLKAKNINLNDLNENLYVKLNKILINKEIPNNRVLNIKSTTFSKN